MQFSKVLKKRRKNLGITQQELASELSVTRQTLSRWENGLSYPDLDTLVKLSEYLSVTLDELIKGKDENHISKLENTNSKVRVYFLEGSNIYEV